MFQVIGRAALLLTLIATGCTSAPIDYTKAKPDRQGSTFLIYGLFAVFSQGLNDVRNDLKGDGYHAVTVLGPAWRDLGDQIIERDKAGTLRRPLVLGGHSLGADKALYLARKLEKNGVRIDYICLLDATNPPAVPGNVTRCHNIYLSHPYTDWFPAFRGIPVSADSTDTELINYDVRYAQAGPLSKIDFNHFDIEADPDIQELMYRLIQAQLSGDTNPAALFPPNSKSSAGLDPAPIDLP